LSFVSSALSSSSSNSLSSLLPEQNSLL
jgi:hypothetical protein